MSTPNSHINAPQPEPLRVTPTIVRQDPPPLTRKSGVNWSEVIKVLEANPNEWFLVGEDVACSSSTYIKRRYGLEARLSGVYNDGDRAKTLHARFVPGKSESQYDDVHHDDVHNDVDV